MTTTWVALRAEFATTPTAEVVDDETVVAARATLRAIYASAVNLVAPRVLARIQAYGALTAAGGADDQIIHDAEWLALIGGFDDTVGDSVVDGVVAGAATFSILPPAESVATAVLNAIRGLASFAAQLRSNLDGWIANRIGDGVTGDWGVGAVIDALTAKSPLSPAQADNVAETATQAATNAGLFAALEVVQPAAIRWVTCRDDKVRPTHVAEDRDTIPFGMTFDVGGYPARFPGDPDLPIGERINCRCSLAYVDGTEARRVVGATKAELRVKATNLAISGRSTMSKAQLQTAVLKSLCLQGLAGGPDCPDAFDQMNRTALLTIARGEAIPGRHKMTRDQLVYSLRQTLRGGDTALVAQGYSTRAQSAKAQQLAVYKRGHVPAPDGEFATGMLPPVAARRALRQPLFEEFGGTTQTTVPCVHCGLRLSADPASGYALLIPEPIIPWSQGGTLALENLVPACPGCFRQRGGRGLVAAAGTDTKERSSAANPKSSAREIHGHHGHHAHGPSILWPALYEHLLAKGHTKASAAAISNAAWKKKGGFSIEQLDVDGLDAAAELGIAEFAEFAGTHEGAIKAWQTRDRHVAPEVVGDVMYTDQHMNVLDDHERGKVGVKLQEMSQRWATALADPTVMAKMPVVTDRDGRRLTTGQSTVHASKVSDMPDDPTKFNPGGDEWDALPVVFKIGSKRIVRDGHHRLMKRLVAGEPISYRYVTEADLAKHTGQTFALDPVEFTGTSEGARKAWDKRGRKATAVHAPSAAPTSPQRGNRIGKLIPPAVSLGWTRADGEREAKVVIEKWRPPDQDGDVQIRATNESLERILASGRFKSQHESGTSAGTYSPVMRRDHELAMFGPQKADPIYGYVNPSVYDGNTPAELPLYGDLIIGLKSSVNERTTVTFGDSLDVPNPPAPLALNRVAGATDADLADAYVSPRYVSGADLRAGGTYVEAQIHGGVNVADIAYVRAVKWPPGAPDEQPATIPDYLAELIRAQGIEVR